MDFYLSNFHAACGFFDRWKMLGCFGGKKDIVEAGPDPMADAGRRLNLVYQKVNHGSGSKPR